MRSPARRDVTPGPTATSSPATSWPRIDPAFFRTYQSRRSEPQIPETRVRINASPAPIRGSGRSTTATPPDASTRTAFTRRLSVRRGDALGYSLPPKSNRHVRVEDREHQRHRTLGRAVPGARERAAGRALPRPLRPASGRRARGGDREGPSLISPGALADGRAHVRVRRDHPASDADGGLRHGREPRRGPGRAALSHAPPALPS